MPLRTRFLSLLVLFFLAACGKQESPAPPPPSSAVPAETVATAKPDAQGSKGGNDSGKTVYDGTCIACHGAGVAGAPKFGDKAAWSARIAQGKDTLYTHAINGFQGKAGVMPAKGGNLALKDEDVRAAVDYMVAHAK